MSLFPGDRITWGIQTVACVVLDARDGIVRLVPYAYCDRDDRDSHFNEPGGGLLVHHIADLDGYVYCDVDGNPEPYPRSREVALTTHLNAVRHRLTALYSDASAIRRKSAIALSIDRAYRNVAKAIDNIDTSDDDLS